MRKTRFIVLFAPFILLLTTCRKGEKAAGIHEGIIRYEIAYNDEQLPNYPSALLPKKMTLKFNSGEAINTIEGFMGFFVLRNKIDFGSKKYITHLKVLNKNYLSKGKRHEQMCCFDPYEGLEIKETEDTKMIAGLECKKLIASFPDTSDTFEVYYTTEIGLRNPNATNPYSMVDGVLMQFRLKFGFLDMEFRANSFESGQSNKLTMDIPDNAKEITRDEMAHVLNRLMN